MRGRWWIAGGAVLASAAVAAGAVGTHVLKESLEAEPSVLETYDIAVRYHMLHALALVLVGLIAARGRSWLVTAAGAAFVAGIVLFSGGLYAWLATGAKPFVAVVPVGGTAWIVGWLLLAAGALAQVGDEPPGGGGRGA
jgi:uncharacterized membrane protein YgdD (TMEM256/DUF423 family)